MPSVRTVSLAALRRDLAVALADAPLLRLRFDRALASRDAAALDDAFRCLQRYPEETRRLVEDTIGGWLFGDAPVALPSPAGVAGDATRDHPARAATVAVAHASAPSAVPADGGVRIQPRPAATMQLRPSGATATSVQVVPSGEV